MVLELVGKEYDYLELDGDFTEDEFTTKFPGKNQFPQVELNGKHLEEVVKKQSST